MNRLFLLLTLVVMFSSCDYYKKRAILSHSIKQSKDQGAFICSYDNLNNQWISISNKEFIILEAWTEFNVRTYKGKTTINKENCNFILKLYDVENQTDFLKDHLFLSDEDYINFDEVTPKGYGIGMGYKSGTLSTFYDYREGEDFLDTIEWNISDGKKNQKFTFIKTSCK